MSFCASWSAIDLADGPPPEWIAVPRTKPWGTNKHIFLKQIPRDKRNPDLCRLLHLAPVLAGGLGGELRSELLRHLQLVLGHRHPVHRAGGVRGEECDGSGGGGVGGYCGSGGGGGVGGGGGGAVLLGELAMSVLNAKC